MSHRGASLLCLSLCIAGAAGADPVPAKHKAGEMHGFLTVRNEEGKLLGYADDVNVRDGGAWRSRLTIHFLDGSLSDESTVYTQGASLHVVSDHLIQKGPTFPKPSDATIDTVKGLVTYHEEKDGKDELKTDSLEMPADLANGMIPAVLENFPHGTDEIKVGYIVTSPKPRLVKLAIRRDGQASYRVGTRRPANHYRIHVELGGVAGVVAPLIGKEPPDFEGWVTTGEAPTVIKLRAILIAGGPLYTLQLVSPEW